MSKSVCFDYDGTLSSNPSVQRYAEELVNRGLDVWVLTFRYDDLHVHLWGGSENNLDMYEVVDSVGIPRHKIIFTNMESKAQYLMGTNVVWLLDDDEKVMFDVKSSGIKTKAIQVNSGSWKSKCERLLKQNIIRKH